MIEVMDSTRFYLGEIILKTCSRVLVNLVQAYLGDIAGSVPDHHNKAGHGNFFLFSSAYKSYVYTIL
jgi:hypothetical protein